MSMNQLLAQMYNTSGADTSSDESTQKVAQALQFAKLAAERGVDLEQFSPEQIQELYTTVFPKTASAPAPQAPATTESAADVEKRAAAYHLEKRAFEEERAKYDFMGRVMAHAFNQELDAIKTAAAKQAGQMPPQFMQNAKKGDSKEPEKKDEKKDEKSEEEKKAAAFENLAVMHAIKLAEANDYQMDILAPRIHAVATLGLKESEKIASAPDLKTAVHVRALEYLEGAGCQVNWDGEQG